MPKSAILTLMFLSALLSGCELEIPFEVDLAKVKELDEAGSGGPRFNVVVRPTISDRFLGAPSKSGSPFVVDVCANSEIENAELTHPIQIQVRKVGSAEEVIWVSAKLENDWVSKGEISCIVEAARIEEVVTLPTEILVELRYQTDGLALQEIHAFEISREVGEKTMTIDDILGQ